MSSKKTFKPPVKNNKKDVPRNEPRSLSDREYDDLFMSVLHPQKAVDLKSPTIGDFPQTNATSPKESASVENSQNSQLEQQKLPPAEPPKNLDSSTLSTINSDEFMKNTVFSTPEKISKPKTYREALVSLKKIKETLSESFSDTDPMYSSIVDLIEDAPLSQPPKHLTRRQRLEWLQERRGTGLFVMCDKPGCGKWRWLDVSDPIDVPHKWFCDMNPDKSFNSCSIPEKPIPMHLEADLIHNSFTAGSVVWAKAKGFPWWPAIVDDCPDCEQYYWVDDEKYDVPSWYNVTFFDVEVSRSWVLVKDIIPFKFNRNLDKTFKVKPNLKKRMTIAKEQANKALLLHVKERLKQYSFLALWKGPLPEYDDSDSSDEDQDAIPNKKGTESNERPSSSSQTATRRISQESAKSATKRNKTKNPKKDVKKPKTIKKGSRKPPNMNKTLPEMKRKKQSRRLSLETLKQDNVKKEFVTKMFEKSRDLFKNGEIERDKFEQMCSNVIEEFSDASFNSGTSESVPALRRSSRKSSTASNKEQSQASTSTESARKRRLSEADTTKETNQGKKKKTFVPPVRKNLNTSKEYDSDIV